MVAGNDHDLSAGRQRAPDILKDAAGRLECIPDGTLAKLDDIAEKHQAVDVGQRAEQRRSATGVAQHIALRVRAEVQVGDDQRTQGGLLGR